MIRLKTVTKNINKLLIFIGILLFSFSVFAVTGRTTYQAKIIKPDGFALEASSVNFRFTLLDPTGSCVLYIEDYAAVNMSGTGGLISFALGAGTRSYPVSSTTFVSVFDNSTVSFACQTPGIYNPTPTDNRKIVMQFNDGGGWQTLPSMGINAVPYAMYAGKSQDSQKLNGKADTAFVENATLASLNCNSATHAIAFNGVSFSCIPVGSGGGGVTSVTTSGTVLITAGTVSAPVISIKAVTMSQDGYLTSLDYAEFKAKLAASSTQIVNTLGYSPVSGAAVTTQINSSNLSGDVIGTVSANIVQSVGGKTAAQISTSVDSSLAATTSATANTIVMRDSSGNASFSGLSANTASLNYVDIYKPSSSFNIRLQAPTSLSTNYILNLPTASGTTGQVLSTDGLGNLSWINASTGSVVSVSATAPLASTGGSTPTISITQATSSTSGFLSATDFNTFNNKQTATSSAIVATLGYTPAQATSATQWTTSGSNIYYNTGNIGVGGINPSAKLELASGTASVAPLKLTSGTLLTSAQSGTMEYDGFNFYLTDGTNTRRTIATASGGVQTNTSEIGSTSNLTLFPSAGNSVIVSATTVSTSSSTGALIVKGGLGVSGNANFAGTLNVVGAISGSAKVFATGYRANQGAPDAVDSSTNGYAFGNDGDTGFFSPGTTGAANGITAIYGNNTEIARFNSIGVGIGTSTPLANLDVASAATISNQNFKATSGTRVVPMQFRSGGNAAELSVPVAQVAGIDRYTGGSYHGGLALYTQNSNTLLERMRIDENGNVGIGTTLPAYNLDVVGSFRSGNAAGGYFGFNGSADVTFGFPARGSAVTNRAVVADDGNTLTFNYANDFSGGVNIGTNTRLSSGTSYINGGNVGIGTTTPTQKLHVSGTIQVDGDLYGGKYGGTRGIWRFSTTDPNYGIFYTESTPDVISFSPQGGGTATPAMVVYGNSVGIGTVTPTAKLEVSGNIKIVDGTQAVDRVLASDAAGTASWQDAKSTVILGAATGSGIATNSNATIASITLPTGKYLLSVVGTQGSLSANGCADILWQFTLGSGTATFLTGAVSNESIDNLSGRHRNLSLQGVVNVTGVSAIINVNAYFSVCGGISASSLSSDAVFTATKMK